MSSSAKTAIIAAALGTAAAVSASTPAAAAEIQKPTVVLVHGAFADGSTWNQVIPLLEEKGLKVVAVQNPLSSLADDVAATRRVLDRQTGPVVLVGHSWGGVAVTEAGKQENVKALVYVAAFAPSEGQSVVDVSKDYLLAEKRELVEQVAST
ncbi:alpha/beta hydrolase, partial [uncultured Ralstonia sp.]